MRIYSDNIGMEFGIKKCAMLKNGKRQITEMNKLASQEKNRTLGEKETYKYLRILETDTIKQVEMKEKNKKNTSGERENNSKPNSIVEISSKR